MNRRLFTILYLLFAVIYCLSAKTTYIPNYYTQINIQGADGKYVDSTYMRDLEYYPEDDRYTITVRHEAPTTDDIKAIKSMKAAIGWTTASAILSAGAAAWLNPMITSWDAVHYMNSMGNMVSSSFMHVAAMNAAQEMQKMPITLFVNNNSEREMTVNDMNRGLTWYIPPHSFIQLRVGNPDVNKLRIAYADCENQKVDYVTIQACNTLFKQTIEYEDDTRWIYPIRKTLNDETGEIMYYESLDKETFVPTRLTKEQLRQIKK